MVVHISYQKHNKVERHLVQEYSKFYCSDIFSGLRRSLSGNVDISELTSIVIKDLAEQYFDKKLLEREFEIFGPNKVSLQPSKQSAVVYFTTHVSD